MPFTSNMTSTVQVDDSIIQAFETEAIIAAGQSNVLDGLIYKRVELGARSISMPTFGRLAATTTALTETDDVTATALSDTKVVLTPAEYGQAVVTTSFSNFQSGGMVDRAAAQIVGASMGNSLDAQAIAALVASTNQMTPSGAAVGALTVGADKVSRVFLNKLRNKLERSFVPTFSNGLYAFVCHPDIVADLREDASAGSFIDITKGSIPELALLGNISMYQGFLIIPDTNCPISAATVKGYTNFAFGANALGKAVSKEASLIIKPVNDMLGRFMSIGWYGVHAYGILDQTAVWKGVTASAYAA